MQEIAKGTRSKVQSIDLQTYSTTAEDWLSDLVFYKNNIRFLQCLLDRFYTDMALQENLDEMREVMMRFQDVKYLYKTTLHRIKSHRVDLAEASQGSSPKDILTVERQHLDLQKEIKALVQSFKETNGEIHNMVDIALQLNRETKMNGR